MPVLPIAEARLLHFALSGGPEQPGRRMDERAQRAAEEEARVVAALRKIIAADGTLESAVQSHMKEAQQEYMKTVAFAEHVSKLLAGAKVTLPRWLQGRSALTRIVRQALGKPAEEPRETVGSPDDGFTNEGGGGSGGSRSARIPDTPGGYDYTRIGRGPGTGSRSPPLFVPPGQLPVALQFSNLMSPGQQEVLWKVYQGGRFEGGYKRWESVYSRETDQSITSIDQVDKIRWDHPLFPVPYDYHRLTMDRYRGGGARLFNEYGAGRYSLQDDRVRGLILFHDQVRARWNRCRNADERKVLEESIRDLLRQRAALFHEKPFYRGDSAKAEAEQLKKRVAQGLAAEIDEGKKKQYQAILEGIDQLIQQYVRPKAWDTPGASGVEEADAAALQQGLEQYRQQLLRLMSPEALTKWRADNREWERMLRSQRGVMVAMGGGPAATAGLGIGSAPEEPPVNVEELCKEYRPFVMASVKPYKTHIDDLANAVQISNPALAEKIGELAAQQEKSEVLVFAAKDGPPLRGRLDAAIAQLTTERTAVQRFLSTPELRTGTEDLTHLRGRADLIKTELHLLSWYRSWFTCSQGTEHAIAGMEYGNYQSRVRAAVATIDWLRAEIKALQTLSRIPKEQMSEGMWNLIENRKQTIRRLWEQADKMSRGTGGSQTPRPFPADFDRKPAAEFINSGVGTEPVSEDERKKWEADRQGPSLDNAPVSFPIGDPRTIEVKVGRDTTVRFELMHAPERLDGPQGITVIRQGDSNNYVVHFYKGGTFKVSAFYWRNGVHAMPEVTRNVVAPL